ncbi:hypothetical protein CVT25_003999 [Psilocybe cyanescens]|uniref:FAD-binding FR-type domain-containing protein n=1 Tax=Psilocybe cyanescens TaxID=93625 RepID=A0A409WXK2_PSICY|nr:hypothetical protein CVT25_003999 [Psilocybe cyanescens]
MWRHLHRTCRKSLYTFHLHPYSQKNFPPSTTKKVVPNSVPDLLPRGRIVNILVAFCAGFSVYFFLDEPVPHIERPSNSPRQFVLSKVISNEDSGPGTKLLKIAAPLHFHPKNNTTNNFDPIWSVYIKDDDMQVERPYTPLTGIDENGHIVFWIKKYPKGEVGRWLHTKHMGEGIEFRGPLKTWPWKEDTWDEIVMISGGTGITPFVQLFHNVISKSIQTSKTQFTLLHSSRVPEELPPPSLLDPMITFSVENPEKFRFHVFVDEQDGSKPSTSISGINTGRITEGSLKPYLIPEEPKVSWWSSMFYKAPPLNTQSRRILFLVCGPEPMIGAIAGPYGRNLSQGSVGGILGKMGFTSDQVYKL